MEQQDQRETASELVAMRDMLREFVRERDWSRFHSPKNLAAALSVEASELLSRMRPSLWVRCSPAAFPLFTNLGIALGEFLEFLIGEAFNVDHVLASGTDGADQFRKLQIDGL